MTTNQHDPERGRPEAPEAFAVMRLNDRRRKVEGFLMWVYDKFIHYPANRRLEKRCAAAGHVYGNWYPVLMGMGRSCTRCWHTERTHD